MGFSLVITRRYRPFKTDNILQLTEFSIYQTRWAAGLLYHDTDLHLVEGNPLNEQASHSTTVHDDGSHACHS